MRQTVFGATTLLLLAAATASGGQSLPTVVSSTFDPATNTIEAPDLGPRNFESYNGLHRSPDDSRWIFVGNLTGDEATDRVIVAGSRSGGGPIVQGQVVARQGGAIPGSMRTLNIVDNPRINDAGQFAFSSNSLGTGSPSVFFFTGSVTPTPTYDVAAAIGAPVPFLPGATYTGGFNSTLLDNTGRFGFAGSINDGTVRRAVIFDNQIVALSGDAATAPTLLPGTPAAQWSDFTLRRVYVDQTGENFYWHGTVAGNIDVAALNNTAVAQEGSAIPPSGPTVLSFFSGWYEPEGEWFLRGTLADTATDFVLRNGQIIAQRGEPIVPGSDIVWDRVNSSSTTNGFLFHVGNGAGDYAVCGNTFDNVTGQRSAAVVINGTTAVAWRGGPIDVNGNGIEDDNTYIRGFKSETGPGTAFLTEAGELWMVVDAETDGGVDLGDAIIRLVLDQTPSCAADFNDSGDVTVQDIFDFLAAYFAGNPSADFNGVGGVTVQDIFDFLAAYFAGC